MANDDKLSFSWELRGTLEKQIKDAIKDADKLKEAISKAAEAGEKIDPSKFGDNFKKNVSEAEKALYKLMDAREKAEQALSRNASRRKDNLFGFDESRLSRSVYVLNEIIDKIMNIGVAAVTSKNAVKNLLAETSADVVLKGVRGETSDLNKQIEKKEKEEIKAARDAAKEIAKAQADEEEAAARNAAAQEKVKDALARIATARSQLHSVSERASQQEQMHVQLLLSLLDRLSQKLAALKGTNLGAKGALTGVLGSGYQGLMRNVGTAIKDLQSGTLNGLGMSDEEWEKNKALAEQARRRREITNAVSKQATAEAKVEEILQMRQHRRQIENAREEREMAAIANQVNRDIAAKKQQQKAHEEVAEAVRRNMSANSALVSTYEKVSSAGTNVNKMLLQMQQQFGNYVSLYGIERLLSNVIKVGGEFEVQHIALKSILGDVEQANSMFSQMKQLAVVSPFNFRQLADYSKQVAAFGIPYEEMYDTTKRLADMAAGLGVDMGRLILAYGQVRSAAVLRGQELRQFTEAGIPMVRALADEFTKLNGRAVTTGEVFELISKRAVPFEMVKKVMWDMTDEGGRFFNMQFVLADTLAGKWSNLQDAWQIMLSQFAKGESVGGRVLKSMVQYLTEIIENIDRLSPIIGGLVAGYGGHKIASFVKKNINDFTLGNIDDNIRKTQKLYALELKRKLLSGEITAETYKQALALNRNKQHYYMLLAQEGKLKEYQIAKAVQQKKINTERLKERVINKEITVSEAAQLRLWRMKYRNANIYLLKLKEIGVTLKGMLGPMGWASLAFDAAFAVGSTMYFDYQRKSDQRNEAKDTYLRSAKDRASELRDTINDYSERKPSSDEDYRASIEAMKEQLRQYDSNYGAIMREVDGIETLSGKYEKLKQELEYVQRGYEMAEQSRGSFEQLQEQVSGLADETKEWSETNTKLNRSLNTLAADGSSNIDKAIDSLVSKIPKLKSAIYDSEGKRRKTGEILSGISNMLSLRDLYDLGGAVRGRYIGGRTTGEGFGYEHYVSVFSNLNKEDREMFQEYIDEARERMKQFEELEPRIRDVVESTYTNVAASLGMKTSELKKKVKEEGNNLDQEIKTMLSNSFHQQMIAITESNKEFIDWLDKQRWTLYFHYDIVTDYTEKKDGVQGLAKTAWNSLNGVNLLGVTKLAGNRLGFSENDIKQAFGESGNDAQHARKYLSQMIADQEATVKSLKATKGATEKQINDAEDIFKARESDWNRMFTDSWRDAGKTGKKGGGKGGNGGDQQLKRWREQLKELQEFWREFEALAKRMSDSDAIEEIRKSGLFPGLFGDGGELKVDVRGGLGKALRDLLASTDGTTTERRSLQTEITKSIFNVSQKDANDIASGILKQLDVALKEQGKRWDLYKRILDATGSKSQAGAVAFGGDVNFGNYAESLRSDIEKYISSLPDDKKVSVDELIDMSIDPKKLRDYGIMEGSTNGIWQKLMLLREEMSKVKAEEVDFLLDALKNAKSLDTELDQIRLRADRDRDSIRKNYTKDGVLTAEGQNLINNVDANEARDIADKRWEYFKKTEDWGRIFGNLDKVSAKTLNGMLSKLRELAPQLSQSAESTKALYEAIAKVEKVVGERNPFKIMQTALSNNSALSKYAKQAEKGDLIANNELSALLGVPLGSVVTKKQIKDAQKASGTEFKTGLEGLVKDFKSVQDALQPVITLFDKLGNTTLANIFKTGSDMLGSAASMASGAVAAFGPGAGIWGAAVGAGLSLVSSIIGDRDTGAWESASRYMQNIDAVVGRIHNDLQEQIRIGNRTADILRGNRASMENIERRRDAYYNAMKGWFGSGAGAGAHSWAYEINNWFKSNSLTGIDESRWSYKINEYLKSKGYEGVVNVIQDFEQMDGKWLKMVYEKFPDFIALLPEDLRKIFENIIDLEKEAEEEAKNVVKALSGLDTDELISEWAGLMDTLDYYNEDFAQSFEKRIRNAIINGMIANQYKEQIQELIDMASKSASNEYYLSTDGTVKRHSKKDDEGNWIDEDVASEYTREELDVLRSMKDPIVNGVTDTAKMIDDIMDWDIDGKNSGGGSSIKSISEETAGLLASYVNAIRADVSVNRVTLNSILQEIVGQREMPALAQAQIAQLEIIARNTGRNADLVQEIRDIMHQNVNGGNGFHIA